jgi:hypothetical protein
MKLVDDLMVVDLLQVDLLDMMKFEAYQKYILLTCLQVMI